jgi:hypothetical protein
MVMIPFRLSFEEDGNKFFDTLNSMDIYFDVIFLTDIVINFNTATYQKGVLIYNRKIIFLNYIKLWFWLDLLSSFPYSVFIGAILSSNDESDLDGENPNQGGGGVSDSIKTGAKIVRLLKFFRFIKVLRLLRVAKLKIIFVKIIEYLRLSDVVIGLLGFIKLAIIVLFIAHWCAW